MMNDNWWLAYIPGIAILIGGVWGLFRHVAATAEKLKQDLERELAITAADVKSLRVEYLAKCESNYSLHEVKIDALRKETEQRVERVAASESKARHDMNNSIAGQLLKLEQSVSRIGEQAVRKEDLSRVERAVETLLLKAGSTEVLSQRVEDLAKRFDKFLEMQERKKGE
jgi:hypothetical protein